MEIFQGIVKLKVQNPESFESMIRAIRQHIVNKIKSQTPVAQDNIDLLLKYFNNKSILLALS